MGCKTAWGNPYSYFVRVTVGGRGGRGGGGGRGTGTAPVLLSMVEGGSKRWAAASSVEVCLLKLAVTYYQEPVY